MRQILAILLLISITQNIDAQIKIDGPKEGIIGYRTKAKLQIDVDDPKIACFPSNDDWVAMQDFAGNKFIDFVPGKKSLAKNEKSKLFTFVVAGNKNNKTYLEIWEVTIRPDEDQPQPQPQPQPTNPLYDKLLAAYMVSPSAVSKINLITVYEKWLRDIDENKFSSFKTANDSRAALLQTLLQPDELRPLRDAIQAHYSLTLGNTGYNKDKLMTLTKDIIDVLKRIP